VLTFLILRSRSGSLNVLTSKAMVSAVNLANVDKRLAYNFSLKIYILNI